MMIELWTRMAGVHRNGVFTFGDSVVDFDTQFGSGFDVCLFGFSGYLDTFLLLHLWRSSWGSGIKMPHASVVVNFFCQNEEKRDGG